MPVAPHGSWASPITSDLVTADTVRLDQVMLDGPDIYWTESQPEKQGRYLVYRQAGKAPIKASTRTISRMMPRPKIRTPK